MEAIYERGLQEAGLAESGSLLIDVWKTTLITVKISQKYFDLIVKIKQYLFGCLNFNKRYQLFTSAFNYKFQIVENIIIIANSIDDFGM